MSNVWLLQFFTTDARVEGQRQRQRQRVEGAEHLISHFGHSPRKTDTKKYRGDEEPTFFPSVHPPIFFTIHPQASQTTTQAQTTMATSEHIYRLEFQTKEGASLPSLCSYPCSTNSNERYILWSDIRRTFQDIDHLETVLYRVLFMINADGALYVLFL